MKSAKPFSKKAEEKLLDAARQVTACVEVDRMCPNAAIAKVAAELKPPLDWIPLLVQAYNHGRTTYQREKCGSDILCKVAEFPLASVDAVRAILYPSGVLTPAEEAEKTAVSKEYSCPPAWADDRTRAAEFEKVAAVELPKSTAEPVPRDPDGKMSQMFGKMQKQAGVTEEARYQAKVRRDEYLAAMGTLGDYFKQAADRREAFSRVEYNATRLFGPVAKAAMDHVKARNRMKEARVTGPPPPNGKPAKMDAEPYSLIKAAIDAGAAVLKAQRIHLDAEKKANGLAEEIIRPFVPAPVAAFKSVLGDRSSASTKEAGPMIGGAVGGMFAGLARSLGQANQALLPRAKTPEELQVALASDLADPAHEQGLREIQVKAMLNDFLANDEVISGFDPDEVIGAYNEIANLSPRASAQAAVIRPLLRKRLTAGSVEPFEAQQMTEIEKTIKETTAPPFDFGGSKGVLHGSPVLAG